MYRSQLTNETQVRISADRDIQLNIGVTSLSQTRQRLARRTGKRSAEGQDQAGSTCVPAHLDRGSRANLLILPLALSIITPA
jgi:hypothetical protein